LRGTPSVFGKRDQEVSCSRTNRTSSGIQRALRLAMTIRRLSARTCRTLIMAALFCGFSTGAAHADGLFIPFIGWNFGGDAKGEFGDAVDAGRFNWGASLGWRGAGGAGVGEVFGT